jgi:hypothetical protein
MPTTKLQCIGLLFSVLNASAAILTGPVENPQNGNTYYLLSQNTWTASQAEAVELGGNLATINSAQEQAWVYETFSRTNRSLWIGLRRSEHSTVFEWASGEPVEFSNWADREPSGHENEHFVHIVLPGYSHSGRWNNLPDVASYLASGASVALHGVVEVVKPVHPFANGSFEEPGLVANQNYPSVTNQMLANWTVEGPDFVVWIKGNALSGGPDPAEGSQHLAFNGGSVRPGMRIYQFFQTEPGSLYEVSFRVGKRGIAGVVGFGVAIMDGVSGEVLGAKDEFATSNIYMPASSLFFEAKSHSSRLAFTDISIDYVNLDVLLDDIRIRPAQAPPKLPGGPSIVDIWDINSGASIIAHSVLDSVSPSVYDVRDIFGGVFGTFTPEAGAVVFSDEVAPFYTHFVEWRTATPVKIRSFRLFARSDDGDGREFDSFRLRAKPVGSSQFSALLFNTEGPYPYPVRTTASGARLEGNIAAVLAQEFRAEFISTGSAKRGPRIIELDGFRDYLPIVQAPLSIRRVVQVSWEDWPTNRFQVQWSSALNTNLWFDLDEPTEWNPALGNSIIDPITEPKRFYRVLRLDYWPAEFGP